MLFAWMLFESGFVKRCDKGIGLTRDDLAALWEDDRYDDVRDEFLAKLATLDDKHVGDMYDEDEEEMIDGRIEALLEELKATAKDCPAVGNAPVIFVVILEGSSSGP